MSREPLPECSDTDQFLSIIAKAVARTRHPSVDLETGLDGLRQLLGREPSEAENALFRLVAANERAARAAEHGRAIAAQERARGLGALLDTSSSRLAALRKFLGHEPTAAELEAFVEGYWANR